MTDEEYRNQCEVRHLLVLRTEGKEMVEEYLAVVEKRRGKDAAQALRIACRDQWAKGNRGARGEWR